MLEVLKYTKDVPNLIIGILLQLLVGIAAGICIGLLIGFPIINFFVGALGALVELYVLAGIIIQILVFVNVIK